MDRLRESLEQVEPPTCPNCHIEMRWYRSTLLTQHPITISHVFVCPSCQRPSDVTSVAPGGRPGTVLPDKLSAPFVRSGKGPPVRLAVHLVLDHPYSNPERGIAGVTEVQ
jgi:hypothetical protein